MFIIISLTAIIASLLTFFTGFGLATILTPVFCLFFSVDLAIGLTAIVHLLNNIFKFMLMRKFANKTIILKFGIPAIFSAFLGAWILTEISHFPPIYSYLIFEKKFDIVPMKIVISLLMICFVLFELLPQLKKIKIDTKYLTFGGMLSGFFGGLSGHQGALRSAFLARAGLNKEEFIGTGIVIAIMIDISRMSLYAKHFLSTEISNNFLIISVATISAFVGAILGNQLLKKINIHAIQIIVSLTLFLFALSLGLGII